MINTFSKKSLINDSIDYKMRYYCLQYKYIVESNMIDIFV